MKALSLRQPWAWMVLHGGKDIENRIWDTKLRGPFLIHAAKGMTADEHEGACRFAARAAPDLVVPSFTSNELVFGAIVGRANLVDVLVCEPGKCTHPWHMPGQFGFVIPERVAFKEPIPVRGMLGFFEPADQVVAALVTCGDDITEKLMMPRFRKP